MQLAYLYIVEHKVLQNIGIPINGEHQCSFSRGELTLEKKSNRVDYYNGLNCSAIIGENGAGKSTILNFIESSYKITDSSGIIVFFDPDKSKYHIFPINIDLKENKVNSAIDYTINDNYKYFISRNKIKLVKVNNLTGVEESTFNNKKERNSFVHDLSLSQYAKGNKSTIIKRTNRLLHFFNHSSWFDGFERTKVNFSFKFKVASTAYVNSLLSKKDSLKLHVHEVNLIKEFIEELNSSEVYDSNLTIDKLLKINILSIAKVISQISILKKINADNFFLSFLLLFIKKDFSESSLTRIIQENVAMSYEGYKSDLNNADYFIIARKYQSIVDVIISIVRILNEYTASYNIGKDNELYSSDTSFIVELTKRIAYLPANVSSNFSYGWNGFSTGEFAKLNLYSELFNYINDIKEKTREHHIIVMDEVDLYLHPDWQRSFFSELITFLNKEYGRTNVQLLLSTHSPIIIGDFLPEDIVSLRINKDGYTEVVESFGFGTQITDLYLDGMHLNSTFGEHSKRVITSIIERRDSGKQTPEDIELIEKIKNKNIQNMMKGSYDKNSI